MEELITYGWFWLGVVLVIEAVAIFFMMGWHKYHRFKNKKNRDVSNLIRQIKNAKPIGHHPCRFDGGVWHEGLCTTIACPPRSTRPKTGALYYANR